MKNPTFQGDSANAGRPPSCTVQKKNAGNLRLPRDYATAAFYSNNYVNVFSGPHFPTLL